MTTSTQRSVRFFAKREFVALAVTLGFIATIPLLVFAATHDGNIGQGGQAVVLTTKGQLIQIGQDKPVQVASAHLGGW